MEGNQSYYSMCPLSQAAEENLQWRISHLDQWNGKSILVQQPDVTIESAASLTGWGAACQGTRTGSPWSPDEKHYYINCLEILAAFLAIKTFAKHRLAITLLVLIENMILVSYINHLQGTVSPQDIKITRQLWIWCLERNITPKAQYLPGVENMTADKESRDRMDWMLNTSVFQEIQSLLGPVEIHVDLFASRLTAQLPLFYS